MNDATITRSPSWREPGRARGAALFVVIDAENPGAGGARVMLRDATQVVIGRAAARAVRREAGELLRLDLPDGRVSVAHARLERADGRWTVADLGSKNGLFVNGQRLERHALEDGDWLELGHTFLRFRDPCDTESDADAAQGLSTLVPAFQAQLATLHQVADKSLPLLLLGETGSGKEVLARETHRLSRREGPFVVVNCGAIPATLVEATLFGHRRGAFSGAVEDRPGLIASADRGTVLLDEVSDLPLSQQAALLRAVQEKEVVPIGEVRPRKVDVRFVAATHRDLDGLVAQERFRADLLARLAGVRITLPPLRERIEDLGILVAAIAPRGTLARDAAWALCRHRWPFNVRELEQALTAALALSAPGPMGLEHLPAALRVPAPGAVGDRDQARHDELVRHLREQGGNLAAVARVLKTSRAQVHRLLERYGIDPRAYH